MAKSLIRNIRGGTSTAYSAEMSEQLALFDVVKKQTDRLVSAILTSLTELNASNSANKWEKLGEMIHTYGAKAVDEQAGSAMRNLKPFFDEIGRLHRKYSTQVEEQVTGPLLAWTKNEYKSMHEEVKKLEKCRTAMDSAADKARKAAGNIQLDNARAEAENAFNQQLSVVREKLDAFFTNQHESHMGILKKFVKLQYLLYNDTSVKLMEAAATITL